MTVEVQPSLFMETRKIYIPYEAIEEAIIQYLEDYDYLASNEIVLGLDLGMEVDDKGLVTLEADLTWED